MSSVQIGVKLRRALCGAAVAVASVAALGLAAPQAGAVPAWPGGPEVPGETPLIPNVPVEPVANFSAPSVFPSAGAVVGVAQPVIINFNEAIGDRQTAEQAISVTTSNGPLDGHFYWWNDSQVRWRPTEFWPANITVTVQAGDTTSSFDIGDRVIVTVDDATKQLSFERNGEVIRTMPVSLGKPGFDTPNGTYIVAESNREMVMDSETIGIPHDDPEGYLLDVEYATRFSNSGLFVHAAPWSEWAQGSQNVSHGCVNISTEDGAWFYENIKRGDAIIVVNTAGGSARLGDGLTDWSS